MKFSARLEEDDKNVQLISDEDDSVVYLDDIDLSVIKEEEKVISTDPFKKVNLKKIRARNKKRLHLKLEKKFRGVEGAESKYIDPESIDGYGLYEIVEPPYSIEALGQLFDENTFLRAVIEARATNTVGLGYSWDPTLKGKRQIQRAASSDEKGKRIRDSHRRETENLNDAFDSFNEEESFHEIMLKVWTDVLATGNGYLEIGRKPNGYIGYIGHVPAKLIRVRRNRDGFVHQANQKTVFFRNFGDSETADPINSDRNPNEMLHFKIYSPNNSYYGVPPAVSAMSAIVGDKFAKEYNIDYFENKAVPRYAIILKGVKLSEKSKKELIKYFRNELKGSNHGTLVVPLPATIANDKNADIRFEQLEVGVQEGSFDKYRKSNRDEIISAYRVPPTKVGVFENANLAVSRDADKTFKSQVVAPDQQIVEKRINRIVKELTDLFLMKFDSLDVIDEEMRSKINDRYSRIMVKTPNEIRQEVGLEPLPGGDEMIPHPTWLKAQEFEYTKEKDEEASTNERGGQEGNDNSASGNPPKVDANGTPSGNDDAEQRREKGEGQDESGPRERN